VLLTYLHSYRGAAYMDNLNINVAEEIEVSDVVALAIVLRYKQLMMVAAREELARGDYTGGPPEQPPPPRADLSNPASPLARRRVQPVHEAAAGVAAWPTGPQEVPAGDLPLLATIAAGRLSRQFGLAGSLLVLLVLSPWHGCILPVGRHAAPAGLLLVRAPDRPGPRAGIY
jgi:hypothetical protein